MESLQTPKLLMFLGLLLILEGLGLPNGRTISFYLILILPFFLFSRSLLKGQLIYVPKKLFFLFLIFFVFSGVSVITSQNVQKSFEFFIYYAASFLVLIYSYNNRTALKEKVIPFIFIFSVIYILYSLFLDLVTKGNASYILPGHGYQFVFSRFGSHNHLGDFLLLPITILLFYLLKARNKLLSILALLFFFPFFLFSYSRSAYLDLIIITIAILFINFKPIKDNFRYLIPVFGALILFSSVFFISTPKDIKIPIFNEVRSVLKKDFGLKGKSATGVREVRIQESIKSFIDTPLFGVGPGNFYIASQKYTSRPDTTATAHNIFLEILVENGFIATIFFALIIFAVFKTKKKGVFYWLGFLLLLNFQTDYTYRILSFFLLFTVLIGLIYEEKQKVEVKKIVLLLSLVLFVISALIFVSNIFSANNNSKFALYFYPLNETAYIQLVDSALTIGNRTEALSLLKYYSKLFSGDYESLIFIARTYEKVGARSNALLYYKRAYKAKHTKDKKIYDKINQLEYEIRSETKKL